MMKRVLIFVSLLCIVAVMAQAQKKGEAGQRERGGEQITEITLERTACFGSCPMYKVTLRRDGTATYVGRRFVERLGTYKGQIHGFERLAQLAEARGYFNLNNRYTVRATDLPSTVTSVVRNGRRKTVTNYGDSGPVELWGIETAIDGLVANTKWEKVSDNSDY